MPPRARIQASKRAIRWQREQLRRRHRHLVIPRLAQGIIVTAQYAKKIATHLGRKVKIVTTKSLTYSGQQRGLGFPALSAHIGADIGYVQTFPTAVCML
jgi:hypothetical protein